MAGMTITEVPVGSSAIASVTYDLAVQTMTVTFTDGSDYTYDGVPPEVFTNLVGSASPGTYFNANVRNVY